MARLTPHGPVHVGDVELTCPVCERELSVPVFAELVSEGRVTDAAGRPVVRFDLRTHAQTDVLADHVRAHARLSRPGRR